MKIELLLTQLEQDKLKLVASDPIMLTAIKKVVLASVYFDGTISDREIDPESQRNFALALASQPKITNEELGANLKAALAGVQLLETGFKILETFGIQPIRSKETKNQAR